MFGNNPISTNSYASTNPIISKLLNSIVSSTVNLLRNITTTIATSTTSIVGLQHIAFEYITLVASSISNTVIKRGMSLIKAITVLSTVRTLTAYVVTLITSVTSNVLTLKLISKTLTKTVTSTVSLTTIRLLQKLLTMLSTNTITLSRSLNKILNIISTVSITYIRAITKRLTVQVVSIASIVAELVQKFGAIAKHTFIVQPRDRLVTLVKDTSTLVQQGKRNINLVKQRIIRLYRNNNG